MKLKLRRSQRSGVMGMGKVTFSLFAQTDLTPQESESIRKYKMGDEILYKQDKVDTSQIREMNVLRGLTTAIAARAMNVVITVNDLVKGKTIDCKDIIEMRAAEEQVKEACATFKAVLESATHFEGEEVFDISA